MTVFNYRLRRQEKGETEALCSARPTPAESAAVSQFNAPKCQKSEIKYIFLSCTGHKSLPF